MGWDRRKLRDSHNLMGRIRRKWLSLVLHKSYQIIWKSRKFRNLTSWISDKRSDRSSKRADTLSRNDKSCSTWQPIEDHSNSFFNFSTYGTAKQNRNRETSLRIQDRRCESLSRTLRRCVEQRRERLRHKKESESMVAHESDIWAARKLIHQSFSRVTHFRWKACRSTESMNLIWLCRIQKQDADNISRKFDWYWACV